VSDDPLSLVIGLCLRFEGVYLKPYLCPAGVPTIGVGSTRYLDGRPVRLDDPPITREHALHMLRETLVRTYMPKAIALCPGAKTPSQIAALTDFAYNCGVGNLRASTLRKRVNAGRWADVPGEFRKWVRGGGRVLPGLKHRAEARISLLGPAE